MSRRRARVLLDCDGPLTAGFFEASCRILRDLGVSHATPEKIDRWDILEAFDVPADVGREAYARLRAAGVARAFEPRPGAVQFVRELEKFADVYIVTAPLGGPYWAHDREEWLRDRLAIEPDRVVSVRDKRVVVGDALVDDRVATLRDWRAEHRLGLGVLWRESHNATETWYGPSANNYDDVIEHLDELLRSRR